RCLPSSFLEWPGRHWHQELKEGAIDLGRELEVMSLWDPHWKRPPRGQRVQSGAGEGDVSEA
ncbi:unnamed protein product, partial [Gulo gulo]